MYRGQIEVLKSCLLFSGISNESLNIMLDCLKPKTRRYKARETVVACGQPFQGLGIVADGEIALAKEMSCGNRILMGILSAGDIFGESVAFSDLKTWPMTVIANKDCSLLFLPPDKISSSCSNICSSHGILINNMLRILSNKALMLNKKIEHIATKNIRGRVSSYLLEIYGQNKTASFTLPMKRYELADYLNIPRPSLSRELGLMRDDGIIAFKGAFITINDVFQLERSIR
jgi:CRP-like cAMP-binding protein